MKQNHPLPDISNDDLAIIHAIKTLDDVKKQYILDIIKALKEDPDNHVINSSPAKPDTNKDEAEKN
jgi:hypothetical protein